MTEISVIKEYMPKPQRAPFSVTPINSIAFVGALLCAPVVVALFTFWLLLVPVFAIPLGLPLYLIMGVPCFMWTLSYRDYSAWQYAYLGFAMNTFAMIAVYLLNFGPLGAAINMDLYNVYFIFGAVFAPAWAYAFARLYKEFCQQ